MKKKFFGLWTLLVNQTSFSVPSLMHWCFRLMKGGPQVQGGGLILPGDWSRGVGGNLIGAPKFYDPQILWHPIWGGPDNADNGLFQKQCGGGYKSRYTTKLLERSYCKLVSLLGGQWACTLRRSLVKTVIMMTSVLWLLTVPVWWTLILSGTSAQGTANLMKIQHCLLP